MPKLTKQLNGFEARDNTLRRDVKANPADRIELEIGDSKRPDDFLPQAKVMRWDNEVNLSVRRQKPEQARNGQGRGRPPTVDVSGGHVVYEDDDEAVHIYERPEVGEDGGLEIELHLKHKPDTSRFDFSIDTKALSFYYQPEITDEEAQEQMVEGDKRTLEQVKREMRPENVVGSYAVYHATKRDNRVGSMEYKTGKFCHIYRPHIIDAEGTETWGELELDEQAGVLTVIVPPEFLGKAVYPVVVDPTFGYTSVGGTELSIFSNEIILSTSPLFEAPEDLTITLHTCHLSGTNNKVYRPVVYRDENLITYGEHNSYTWRHQGWTDNQINEVFVEQGDLLQVGFWSNGASCYADSVTDGQSGRRRMSESYSSSEAPPATFTETSFQNGWTYSQYLTYEAGSDENDQMVAQPGTYTLTGQPVSFRRHYVIKCETGTYDLTGQDADLTRALRIAQEAGDFALTGVPTALRASRRITPQSGSYALTGSETAVLRDLRLTTQPGTYELDGVPTSLTRALRLPVESGSYQLTGFDIRFFDPNDCQPLFRQRPSPFSDRPSAFSKRPSPFGKKCR